MSEAEDTFKRFEALIKSLPTDKAWSAQMRQDVKVVIQTLTIALKESRAETDAARKELAMLKDKPKAEASVERFSLLELD